MKEEMYEHGESGPRAPIKPYCVKDLMLLYGVSRYLVDQILEGLKKELGDRQGKRYLSLRQVRILFTEYGHPAALETKTTSEES